jgi:hypothetical protein
VYWLKQPTTDTDTPWDLKTIELQRLEEPVFVFDVDMDGGGVPDYITTYKEGDAADSSDLGQSHIRISKRTDNSGGPEFSTAVINYDDNDLEGYPEAVNFYDFDGDSKPELIWTSRNPGRIYRAENSGSITSTDDWIAKIEELNILLSDNKNLNTEGFAAGGRLIKVDVDNDGDMDLFTTDQAGGYGVVWLENPKTVTPPTALNTTPVQLVSSSTFEEGSNIVFSSALSNAYDGNTATTAVTDSLSFFVTFDLGDKYMITSVEVYGDNGGSIQTGNADVSLWQGGAWNSTGAFSATEEDWNVLEKNYGIADKVKFTITGENASGAELPELRIYGYKMR